MNTPREVEFSFQAQDEQGNTTPISGSGFLMHFSQATMGPGGSLIPVLLLEDRNGRIMLIPAEACKFKIPTLQLMNSGNGSGLLIPGRFPPGGIPPA